MSQHGRRLDEYEALRADAQAVAALPMGSFISHNCLAALDDPGRTLGGKVF